MGSVLRFGIPSLDALWTPPDDGASGIVIHDPNEATSLCIVGADGSGKTVLGLHLAARYVADCHHRDAEALPYVIYAASDLSYGTTKTMWTNFDLYHPNSSEVCRCRWADWMDWDSVHVGLRHCSPLAPSEDPVEALPGVMSAGKVKADVLFLDLASNTAGDDWAYLTRLLASLPKPAPDQPRHLLVLDSVEGLEALTGQWDAHGEVRDRRSRLAQLLRAGSDRCHVALLLEEMEPGRRTPEQFVTDTVIHLSMQPIGDFLQRTIEIEKSRGTAHVRGRHPYVVRDGKGSSSDGQPNPDNPERLIACADGVEQGYRSHFHVHQTLHGLDPDHASLDNEAGQVAQFGIPYLDELMGSTKSPASGEGSVPAGTMTAVIGDEGTYKARLGAAFMAGALRAGSPNDVAILITTQPVTRADLFHQLAGHLGRAALTEDEQSRVLLRHLGTHHFSAETLYHLIREMIVAGVRRASTADDLFHAALGSEDRDTKIRRTAGHVRLYLDDLGRIINDYPAVAKEPLFVPCLHRLIREYRVQALITDTQPGNPNPASREERDRVLRSLASRVIYTWHVPFMGESRVALAVVPPADGDHAAVIRELRVRAPEEALPTENSPWSGRLWVDPHFEVYSGLDKAEPYPEHMGVDVHLFTEAANDHAYYTGLRRWLQQAVPCDTPSRVDADEASTYDSLRDLINACSGLRRNRGLVVQVDEFWALSASKMVDLSDYLEGRPADGRPADPMEAEAEDPLGLWRTPDGDRIRRLDHFEPEQVQRLQSDQGPVLKIPYSWDFGLIMCHAAAWERAAKLRFTPGRRMQPERMTVGALLGKLGSGAERVTWRAFLRACQVVADAQPHNSVDRAFEVSMTAPETYSCLVLELWLSEIQLAGGTLAGQVPSLPRLLRDRHRELLLALVLLGSVLDIETLPSRGLTFESTRVTGEAVASRHWYGTACAMPRSGRIDDLFVPYRLPGSYVTRGDWYLAVPRATRSRRLSMRALDVLLSRRANAERLQHGVGLPVRKLADSISGQSGVEDLWTPLYRVDARRANRLEPLSYHDLARLAAPSSPCATTLIWRSRIPGYDAHNRTWSKWLCRQRETWSEFASEAQGKSTSGTGFGLYDAIENQESTTEYAALAASFQTRCEFIAASLEAIYRPADCP